MKIIIELLKKDLLKFRWLLALWVALVVSWHATLLLANGENFQLTLTCSFVFMCLSMCLLPVLTILVMQSDAIVNNSAFWLTRPIQPWKILASKGLLLLALAVTLAATVFITTLTLFALPATELWRRVLSIIGNGFCVAPLCALIASITRNFLAALIAVLILVVTFFISATIVAYTSNTFHLWLTPVILAPLAGVFFQYQTRRTWLTVSGCVLALLVAFASFSSTEQKPPAQDARVFIQRSHSIPFNMENITTQVRDGNVIISVDFDTSEKQLFEWNAPSLNFKATDGNEIELRGQYSIHIQGATYMDKTMILPGGRTTIKITLISSELRKISGQTGILRVNVSGKFYRYQPLATVPADGKRWTIIGSARIITTKMKAGADRDSEISLLIYTLGNNTIASGVFSMLDNHNDQYILQRIGGGEKIPLSNGSFSSRSIAFRGLDSWFLEIVLRANQSGVMPETLDGWEIGISRRVFDDDQTVGATFEIPNFTASGTN